ncbi:hypothetical protein MMC30_008393 [Trapelia coarctata]|nr:hypothetical protein [Trapelia coarctata]
MLPFGGQGANQAIEDGGVLGVLFKDASVADVPKRLKDFEDLRIERVAPIQILSGTRFGREMDIQHLLEKYEKPSSKAMPRSLQERLAFEWRCEHAFFLRRPSSLTSTAGTIYVKNACNVGKLLTGSGTHQTMEHPRIRDASMGVTLTLLLRLGCWTNLDCRNSVLIDKLHGMPS